MANPVREEYPMKIVSIESFTTRHLCIVRVKGDDGSEGYGQTAPFHANITALVLHQQVAPAMIGAEIGEPGGIADFAESHISRHYKFAWSYICRAVAGVETALWDLSGKRSGKSVCELLGGAPRPLPVYGSSMKRDISPEDEAARLVSLQNHKGIDAFKIRIGSGLGDNADVFPGRTERVVEVVRKALGEGTSLYADANGAYKPEKAIEVGRMLLDRGVCHYEEPCPFPELEWTRQVTEALSIPVTGGEQDNDMAQWRRMIAMRAVNVVQPDIGYVGGFSRALEVARLARSAGILCMPHAANKSLLTVFTAHLLASIPNGGERMEFSIENETITKGLFNEPLDVQEGHYVMPEGPGWGISVNPDWLREAEYAVTR
ncbi:mandelate racemase/muconate lactonizing enzyme family protein [Paenibacillus sepulcri]|uniref:mandelate racemase/muconate lactonizing enzyme family protein n=1 Tax=Paenibacillus sepulcri TaxID=359917 RepID=UPI0036146AF9